MFLHVILFLYIFFSWKRKHLMIDKLILVTLWRNFSQVVLALVCLTFWDISLYFDSVGHQMSVRRRLPSCSDVMHHFKYRILGLFFFLTVTSHMMQPQLVSKLAGFVFILHSGTPLLWICLGGLIQYQTSYGGHKNT